MRKKFKPYAPDPWTDQAARKAFFDKAPGSTFLEKVDLADDDDAAVQVFARHATDMLLWGFHQQSPEVQQLIGLALELGSLVGLGSGIDAMTRKGGSDNGQEV